MVVCVCVSVCVCVCWLAGLKQSGVPVLPTPLQCVPTRAVSDIPPGLISHTHTHTHLHIHIHLVLLQNKFRNFNKFLNFIEFLRFVHRESGTFEEKINLANCAVLKIFSTLYPWSNLQNQGRHSLIWVGLKQHFTHPGVLPLTPSLFLDQSELIKWSSILIKSVLVCISKFNSFKLVLNGYYNNYNVKKHYINRIFHDRTFYR